MTAEWFMQWIYGGVTLGSLYALVLWIPLVAARFFADDFKGATRDGYLHVTGSGVLGCMGTFGLSASRTYDMIVRESHPTFADPIVALVCLCLLGLSRAELVYASSLNERPWRWRLYLLMLAAWTGLLVVRQ